MEQNKKEVQAVHYSLKLQTEGIHHTRYEKEIEWLAAIEQGTLEPERIPGEISILEDVGILAKDDVKKQVEYAVISGICLATRAAIRGGVNPEKAYSSADLRLQRIAQCRNAQEIISVFQETIGYLVDKVREAKEKKRNSFYTEQCRDYIERNLTRKFSIQEMAHEMGISRSYLSDIFSRQMGETITSFLRRKRLETSRMLLETTAMTIGEIAQYLCFNSQSHFGKCFKDKYGMTPVLYRNQKKIIDSASGRESVTYGQDSSDPGKRKS